MSPIHNCKLVQVVRTEVCAGAGTEFDPCRVVVQYWSVEGELLATHDPCA